jgi:hypothetical protein
MPLFNNYPEDLVLPEDDVLFAIHLDFGAGVLAEKDAIAGFDVHGNAFAFLIEFAGAYGDYFSLLGFLFGAVGDDDAALFRFGGIEALDDDAVMEGSDIHRFHFRSGEKLSLIRHDFGECAAFGSRRHFDT